MPDIDWATWSAVYDDDTVIRQKDYKVGYDDLDRDRIIEFQMWVGDKMQIAIPVRPGQGSRLVWRRRVQMFNDGTQRVFYIVGKRGGFMATMFDIGLTVIDDKFRDDHGLYMDIEPVKGEEGWVEDPKE